VIGHADLDHRCDLIPCVARFQVIPSLERKHGEDHLFLEDLQSYPMRMTIDPHSPVTSLDQLYMQAIVANVLLLDKV
jgi:hypothetical protein